MRPRLGLSRLLDRRQVPINRLESDPVRAEQTRYTVPGWGVGELWTSGAVVLAHDFRFDGIVEPGRELGDSDGRRVRERLDGKTLKPLKPLKPPKGAPGPPTGTVLPKSAHVGNGFVPDRQQRRADQSGSRPNELVERFVAFLAGDPAPLDDVELDLTWATPFQRSVAGALRSVPRGEVVTYGELAALGGHPGAARAAGSFCARNPFAFLLPCHRVVGSDGIGGYGSAGVGVKRRLLALEGVAL